MPEVQDDPNFMIFIIGYAQFWNQVDTGCDSYSFAVFANYRNTPGSGSPAPDMATTLRAGINTLILNVNSAIQNVISTMNNPKLMYVDIDDLFEGHRWCEPASSFKAQNDNSWFWNWPLSNYADTDIITNVTAVPFDWSETVPPDNTTMVPINTTVCSIIGNPQYRQDWNDQWLCAAWKNGSPAIDPNDPREQGSSTVKSGYFTQIFHPKIPGHAAMEVRIKDTIKANFKG